MLVDVDEARYLLLVVSDYCYLSHPSNGDYEASERAALKRTRDQLVDVVAAFEAVEAEIIACEDCVGHGNSPDVHLCAAHEVE